MTVIIVYSVWKSEDRIEVPDADAPEILAELNRGGLNIPEEIADQITSNGADLTDWSAKEVRR